MCARLCLGAFVFIASILQRIRTAKHSAITADKFVVYGILSVCIFVPTNNEKRNEKNQQQKKSARGLDEEKDPKIVSIV